MTVLAEGGTLPADGAQVIGRSAPARRRIDLNHWSFLRSVIEGIPLRRATDLYLEEGMDLRLAQRELRWLRTELLAAARRAGAYGDARALQIDVASLPQPATPTRPKLEAPSLDEFRELVVYLNEDDLIAQYVEAYPPQTVDRRAARIARLRARQRRALDVLRDVLVQKPRREDPVSSWLDPNLAARLDRIGLRTLGALVDWIGARGRSWHARIPGIGAKGAERVQYWLERNAEPLQARFDPARMAPRRELMPIWQAQMKPATNVAPLERLLVPAEVDGSHGLNRIHGNVLAARNDRDAIEAWLKARSGRSPETARAYRREAERLLLWSIFEQRVALSSLTVEDATRYREFLANPQPAERWIARKSEPRLSPNWRPFRGPLARRSVEYALLVVGSLFEWLVRQHYLRVNVFGALDRKPARDAASQASDTMVIDDQRYLSRPQWASVCRILDAIGQDENALRTRVLFQLGYTTGLRRAELADARIGRLVVRLGEAGQGGAPARRVLLGVIGKGGKARRVPLLPEVEVSLNAYLQARGLPDWIALQRAGRNDVRLIARLGAPDEAATSLSTRQIYVIVKQGFERTERYLREQGLDADAAVLGRASTHWLRHTFGRHRASAGVPMNIVQSVLGHSDPRTLALYTTDHGEDAYDALAR